LPFNDPYGSLRPPIYDSVAFEFKSSEDLQQVFEGKKPAHAYSRITNPTVEELEQRMKGLTDAAGVIATSSGMAAIADILLSLAEAGSNIIASNLLFGNTISLLSSTLRRWGLETRYAPLHNADTIRSLIDEKTRAVFFESITNPQLEVIDISSLCRVADRYGIPVILDGTLTTPYIFKSKTSGVAVEIISSTKFISGGATSIGGLIIDNGVYDWSENPGLKELSKKVGSHSFLTKLRREVFRNLGNCLSPHSAYLQTLGLETLAIRIDRCCENALNIARFLEKQKKVKSVNFPGLESSPYHDIAKSQFGGKFGGILTFNLANKAECFKFMDQLTMIKRATNLNDNKTLILHPASTIFCEYSQEDKARMKIDDNMMRLAVGIEDIEDILDDIQKGLNTI